MVFSSFDAQACEVGQISEFSEKAIEMPDGHKFHAAKHEVSVAEWNACFVAGGCGYEIAVKYGVDPHEQPATGIGFLDAWAYIDWLSAQDGRKFRLPTREEWLFMASDVVKPMTHKLFDAPELAWAANYNMSGHTESRALLPRGEYGVNQYEIYDLAGSVSEWTSTCYDNSITDKESCAAFYIAGENGAFLVHGVRHLAQGGCGVRPMPVRLGLRLVLDELT